MAVNFFEKRKEDFFKELVSLGFEGKEGDNVAVISGDIEEDFEYSHQVGGEKFYKSRIAAKRKSDTIDYIPVIIGERVADAKKLKKGKYIEVLGEFLSYHENKEGESHLILYVFPKEIHLELNRIRKSDINMIYLKGALSKPTVYRKTPKGMKITDVMLRIRRKFGRKAYIPCISWNIVAKYMNKLQVREDVEILGRIQSREYFKRFSKESEEGEDRIAYEVSIMTYSKKC